ncbi:hypothetical protein VTH06DRAFT_7287 [Thermothelomyces fergusii]
MHDTPSFHVYPGIAPVDNPEASSSKNHRYGTLVSCSILTKPVQNAMTQLCHARVSQKAIQRHPMRDRKQKSTTNSAPRID